MDNRTKAFVVAGEVLTCLGLAVLVCLFLYGQARAVSQEAYTTADFRVSGDAQVDGDALIEGVLVVNDDITTLCTLRALDLDLSGVIVGDVIVGGKEVVADSLRVMLTSNLRGNVTTKGNVTAATGTVSAEQLTSTDDMSVTDHIGCTTITATGLVQGVSTKATGTAYGVNARLSNSVYAADSLKCVTVGATTVTATGTVSAAQLTSTSSLAINGELTGDRIFLTNARGAASADNYLGVDGIGQDAALGPSFPYSGTILAVTVAVYVNSHTDGATIRAYVKEDGVSQTTCAPVTATINDNGWFKATVTTTRALGDDFDAGDIINCWLDFTGTCTTTYEYVTVLIQLDN